MADVPSRQELIDLYESYQEYQHAKKIAEVRHARTHMWMVWGASTRMGVLKGARV